MTKNKSPKHPIINNHYFLKQCIYITNVTIKGLEQWQATLEEWLNADEVEEIEFEIAFIRMCRSGGVELTNTWWQDLYQAITGKRINNTWLHNIGLLFLPKWVDKDVSDEINRSINREILSK